MMSSETGMRPKRQQLTKLYNVAKTPYEILTKAEWDWNKDEKKRVLQSFIMFCELQGVRDRERLDEMMDAYSIYIMEAAKTWIGWQHASRINYLGFVLKKDNMAIYVAKMNQPKQNDAQSKNIAGTKESGDWEF